MEPPEPLFPVDIHINEIREAIKGRTDFRECVFEDHTIFVYFLGMAKDIFPNPYTAPDDKTRYLYKLRRECRGNIFSNETGKVIARRFHKFFNVNETEETQVQNIKLDQPFVILEKMDGSMISPFFTVGQLRFGTKNGITDTSKFCEDFISTSQIPYKQYCEEWIKKGYTPLFEWVSNKCPIVLHYDYDSLNLIALRNVRLGTYYPFNEMVEDAKKFGIPTVKSRSLEEMGIDTHNDGQCITPEELVKFCNRAQQQTNVEGFVLRFADGTMLKTKTHWYFEINHGLDAIKRQNERHKWECILGEKYDDLKVHLTEEERESMDNFARDLISEFNKSSRSLVDSVLALDSLDRKKFAQFVERRPKYESRILWMIYKELSEKKNQKDEDESQKEFEYQQLIGKTVEFSQKMVLSSCSNKGVFDSLKPLVGNITFETYEKKGKPKVMRVKDE